MSELRFYAACLASYNAGTLHGAWIDASTDVDAMQEAVAAMLRKSPYPNVEVACPDCEGGEAGGGRDAEGRCTTCGGPGKVASAEEWAVHDTDGYWPRFGEHSDLKLVARYVEVVEEADSRGIDAEATVEVIDHFGASYLDLAERAIRDNYRGTYSDLAAYAEEYADDCGMLDGLPDLIRHNIDFEGVARELELGGDVFTVDGGDGVLVFEGGR